MAAEVHGSTGGRRLNGHICVAQEINQSLAFLLSALAEEQGDQPFVAIVKSRDELLRWLGKPLRGLQWIQVEGLLSDHRLW